jgi:hypothetical protein
MNSKPCEICGKVSWYFADRRYFCGGHKKEAYAAAQVERRKKRKELDEKSVNFMAWREKHL